MLLGFFYLGKKKKRKKIKGEKERKWKAVNEWLKKKIKMICYEKERVI